MSVSILHPSKYLVLLVFSRLATLKGVIVFHYSFILPKGVIVFREFWPWGITKNVGFVLWWNKFFLKKKVKQVRIRDCEVDMWKKKKTPQKQGIFK